VRGRGSVRVELTAIGAGAPAATVLATVGRPQPGQKRALAGRASSQALHRSAMTGVL
jgi:hypothetical protein